MNIEYIIELKNDFFNNICSIISPYIYEGLMGFYNHSNELYDNHKDKQQFAKITPEKIFVKYLYGIKSINEKQKQKEYDKIRSKHNYDFNNLIKFYFKCYLIYLNYFHKNTLEDVNVNDIDVEKFVIDCYFEVCDYFILNPDLFSKYNKNRKYDIIDVINTCIDTTVKKTIKLNDTLKKFIEHDFSKATDDKKMDNIENKIKELEQKLQHKSIETIVNKNHIPHFDNNYGDFHHHENNNFHLEQNNEEEFKSENLVNGKKRNINYFDMDDDKPLSYVNEGQVGGDSIKYLDDIDVNKKSSKNDDSIGFVHESEVNKAVTIKKDDTDDIQLVENYFKDL